MYHCRLDYLPEEKILKYILIIFRAKSNCFFEGLTFWDNNDKLLLELGDVDANYFSK